MKRPRVLLADDHALVVEGLRHLLEREVDLVGTVGDGRALLAAATQLKPDVILLDISMPGLNGIDAARQLTQLVPESKLIFVTMHGDPTYVGEAFRAGAVGYLVKRCAARELVQAIRTVLAGRPYITPWSVPTRRQSARARHGPRGSVAGSPRGSARCSSSWPRATRPRRSRPPSPSRSRQWSSTRPASWST
jgi:DNA-binding NarL/FixJ family response regulator